MARKGKDARRFRHGDRVRIAGHVGCERERGGDAEFHGDRGTVDGLNASYSDPKSGEQMVSMRTQDGSFIAVPARALEQES